MKRSNRRKKKADDFFDPMQHMFTEDITCPFSIDFLGHDEDFYIISPGDKRLENLLNSEKTLYFRYEFERQLMKCAHELFFKGKAYIELSFLKDENDMLKGVSFMNIKAKKLFKFFKYTFFVGEKNKRWSFFHIRNDRLICYHLQKLGFRKNYFRKNFRKLKEISITSASDFFTDSKMNGVFDFSSFIARSKKKEISIFSKVGWTARDTNNVYLSECYSYYQRAKYLAFKWETMEYLLDGINQCMNKFSSVLKTSSIIATNREKIDFLELYKKFCSEEITADELMQNLYYRG